MTPRNVLVLCGGKWVGTILHLKRAMRDVDQLRGGELLVADMADFTPAGYYADRTFVVPRVADPAYVDRVLDICTQNDVRVLIPHIDIDLERLAPRIEQFERLGTSVICPPPDLVDLCLDKTLFEHFARKEGLAHPMTYRVDDICPDILPLFMKRRRGFGSIGSSVCRTRADALAALEQFPDLIFQEVLTGPEISVDSLISNTGRCVVAVQRVRDKVVGGEAINSHTVKWPAVRELAAATIDALAAHGLRGPANVQLFAGDRPALVEVNTRLASACPLSNVASGGRLFASLLREACGQICDGDPDDYIEDLSLYRFYGEAFHCGSEPVIVLPGEDLDLATLQLPVHT